MHNAAATLAGPWSHLTRNPASRYIRATSADGGVSNGESEGSILPVPHREIGWPGIVVEAERKALPRVRNNVVQTEKVRQPRSGQGGIQTLDGDDRIRAMQTGSEAG